MTLLAHPVVLRARARLAPRRPTDLLFLGVWALLIAAHATVYAATYVLAPVTVDEQRSLDLLQLPLEVARILTLPFLVVLLVSLALLGHRIAGRWAGMTTVFAALALDTRADAPLHIVYGPSVALGGYPAAALLALALVLLPRRRLAAAVALGAAAWLHGLTALALPAFLVAIALFPPEDRSGRRSTRPRVAQLAAFVGAFAVPFAVGQTVWLLALGGPGYAAAAEEVSAVFDPGPALGFIEQQTIIFGVWHLPVLLTVSFAVFLFLYAGFGVWRYLAQPTAVEIVRGSSAGPLLTVARRVPIELWAAFLTLVLFLTWWPLTGTLAIVAAGMPMLTVVMPLITALAYRGAKWQLSVGGIWRLGAVVYLIGLYGARSVQAVWTVVDAFIY